MTFRTRSEPPSRRAGHPHLGAAGLLAARRARSRLGGLRRTGEHVVVAITVIVVVTIVVTTVATSVVAIVATIAGAVAPPEY